MIGNDSEGVSGRSGSELFQFGVEELASGTALFREPCNFIKSVVQVEGLPEAARPEISFAGRSNVGKSSLINALCGRKSLARTSNTPGRTRELNYYAIGEALYLVDMPGYGYARASKSEIKGWTALMRDYLRGRTVLARVFLLIDSRHGLKASDHDIMTVLDEAAVSYQAVLTKIDKLTGDARGKCVESVAEGLARRPAAFPHVLATSARKNDGIAELRAAVATAVGYSSSSADG